MAKKPSRAVKSAKKPAPSKGKKVKAKSAASKTTKSKPGHSHASGKKPAPAKKISKINKVKLASTPKPVKSKITKKKKKEASSIKHKSEHTKSIKTVGLSKLGKAKIKPKVREFIPRKIEKIIDISKLENKLHEIMKLDHTEFSVEEKLKALYVLQEIDSNIDKIRTIRGELPMEVTDLEDEVAGLETRIQHVNSEIEQLNEMISRKKQAAKDSKDQIKKYESQQSKVKNNREYDSLNKEIEFQNLEIQLADKRVKEYNTEIITKNALLESAAEVLEEKKGLRELKRKELDSIIEETRKEEDHLKKISDKARTIVDERLLGAYQRVRTNARNGLGVVAIQRDACGGCFNKIPPQRQLDIRQHKKIIVCEHCGRILVDSKIEE